MANGSIKNVASGVLFVVSRFFLAVSGRHHRRAVSAVQATIVPGQTLLPAHQNPRATETLPRTKPLLPAKPTAARPLINSFTEQQSQRHHQPPAAFSRQCWSPPRRLLGPHDVHVHAVPSPGTGCSAKAPAVHLPREQHGKRCVWIPRSA